MAVFTTEIRALVKSGFELGLDEYPIFDEAYRAPLNAMIIEHFFFREIGLETPELFKRFLNRKMNEIMPAYNQLLLSTRLQFDPLINSKITTDANTDATQNSNGTTTGTSHDTGTGRVLASTTPQMQLAGNEDYATGLTDSNSVGDNTSEGTQENATTALTNYLQTVTGLTGMTASAALLEYRQTIINVNLMIIDELEPLFMGIWSNTFGGL